MGILFDRGVWNCIFKLLLFPVSFANLVLGVHYKFGLNRDCIVSGYLRLIMPSRLHCPQIVVAAIWVFCFFGCSDVGGFVSFWGWSSVSFGARVIGCIAAIPAILCLVGFPTGVTIWFGWSVWVELSILSFRFLPFVSLKLSALGFIVSIFVAVKTETSFWFTFCSWCRCCFNMV